MNFTYLTVPGQGTTLVTIEAAVLRITEGCLAVQKITCDEGEPVYLALHVPSGGNITRNCFDCPERAGDALVSFWTRLDEAQRKQLMDHDEPTAWLKNRAIGKAFRKTWQVNADGEIAELEEATP